MDVLSDAISATRVGRPTLSLVTADSAWRDDVGSFQGARFYVAVSGSLEVTRSGMRTAVVGPSDAVLIPRGTAHTIENVADSPARFLSGAYRLDQARPHPMFQSLPDVVLLRAGGDRYPGLQASIELLRDELEEEMHGRGLALPALLEVLFVHLIRACLIERAGLQETGWCIALDDETIALSLRAIHEYPADPWTVGTLGAHAGLSRAAFARKFTTLVGQPPLAYLTWWRLTTAARLLQETDLPLTAVAHRIGYASVPAFANAFKREFGVSAGRFRQRVGIDGDTPAQA